MGVATELRVFTSIGASLSILSCLFVLLTSRLLPRGRHGGGSNSSTRSFNVQLLNYWAWSELIAASSNLIYRVDDESIHFNPDGSVSEIALLCRTQGSLMHFGYLSSFFWLLCASFNAYLQVFYLEAHPKKFELLYILIAWGLPLIDTIIISPLLFNFSGPTDLWCWIGSSQHATAQWINFYFPLILICILVVILHFVIERTLDSRMKRGRFGTHVNRSSISSSDNIPSVHSPIPVPIASGGVSTEDLLALRSSNLPPPPTNFQRQISAAQNSWRTYLLLFFLLRVPGLVHRACEYFQSTRSVDSPVVDQPEVYGLQLLHAIASPLQGVLVLILFLMNPRMKNLLQQRWRQWSRGKTVHNTPTAIVSGKLMDGTTVTANSGSAATSSVGYRSLSDQDAANAPAGLQSVFPPAVWSTISSTHASDSAPLVPPTNFRTFPTQPAQTPIPSTTPANDITASLRVMTGSWNMGNEYPPCDLTHPAFEESLAQNIHPYHILPTDASHSLNLWIPSGNAADDFDVLAIGVQECEYDPVMGRGTKERVCCSWRDQLGYPTTEKHWFEIVKNVINRGRDQATPPSTVNQPDHRPFHTVAAISMGHIRLIVLIHARLVPLLSDVHTSIEGAGLGNMYENKGGVGISFKLGLRRLAFINVHLAALDGFQEDRNEDVIQILARLQLQGGERHSNRTTTEFDLSTGPSHSRNRTSSRFVQKENECSCAMEADPTLDCHACFFLGDLNYRFAIPSVANLPKKQRKAESTQTIARCCAEKDFNKMIEYDELSQLMKYKRLFVGWTEPLIQFFPTYKYRLDKTRSKQLKSMFKKGGAGYMGGNPILASTRVEPTGGASASSSPPVAHLDHDISLYDAKRTPAFCDRILFHGSSSTRIQVLEYHDVFEINSSDHKPICASFQIDFDRTTASRPSTLAAVDEESKESSSSSSTPPAASPRRRLPKRETLDPANEFVQQNPGAVDVISPASLKLLSSVTTASPHATQPKELYRIRFHSLALYDTLDPYGSPLSQPYISFVGDVLCGNSCGTGGGGRPGSCIRSHTAIAQPLPSSSDALIHLAESSPNSSVGQPDIFSLFQSSPVALQGHCIRTAEWDPIQPDDPNVPVSHEIPLLATAYPITRSQLQCASIQLLIKDALNVGEVDVIGIASVELGPGLMVGGVQAEPVFFISPILAQTKYMGFISGYLKVEPI